MINNKGGHPKPVERIAQDGKITEWPSAAIAARACFYTPAAMSNYCQGKSDPRDGNVYRYKEEPKMIRQCLCCKYGCMMPYEEPCVTCRTYNHYAPEEAFDEVDE